jgi:hypothetical protein
VIDREASNSSTPSRPGASSSRRAIGTEQQASDAPDAVGAVVRRLARPHASGGTVIERSVIIAEGSGSAEILSWISAHDGVADSTAAGGAARTGLHGAQLSSAVRRDDAPARRFVLPPGAFD